MTSTTPQLDFWRGDFGNSYVDRNTASGDMMRARVAMWSEILSHTLVSPPTSILEVGANLGINLRALGILSNAKLIAVEPNDKAREILVSDGVVAAENALPGFASAIDLATGSVDLTFTSGVLIHIHPDDLAASLAQIHRVSSRWICCIEYFSDKPEMIPYRGHNDKLFKRDFGGL